LRQGEGRKRKSFSGNAAACDDDVVLAGDRGLKLFGDGWAGGHASSPREARSLRRAPDSLSSYT
jgi:hypothetical protein